MATTDVSYKLIDSAEDLRGAIADVKGANRIALDCEGIRMSREGTLELVQIGIEGKEEVLIVDIRTVGTEGSQVLQELFEDANVEVLMWDCRRDCDVLKHFLGMDVNNIVDLQLADTLQKKHMAKPYIKRKGVEGYPRVVGLRKTLQLLSETDETLHRLTDLKSAVSITEVDWTVRPIAHEVLLYAAVDVLSLFPLYTNLVCPASHSFKNLLSAASMEYSSLLTSVEKLRPDYNLFFSYIITPGVLCPLPLSGSGRTCPACCRNYPNKPELFYNHCRVCGEMCHVCADLYHRHLKKNAVKE
eukprot:TRINITY_DN1212_c5_g1_i1.p1 TRINITY_DN1212_c5_g1~~TRINITY_DN1212_c5_g1_i1.p1  ORF type:complete len:301 (+),score=28.02 TRINITY_DN1212_c5_g1_i1:64-966(+)